MATWKRIITDADDASYSNSSIDAGDLPAHSGGLITSGTVAAARIETASVTNGATTIPTGNDVYDFVVVQGYSTATGVANNADVTGSNTSANASAYTGASIATTYTSAKCTDPDADETSANECARPLTTGTQTITGAKTFSSDVVMSGTLNCGGNTDIEMKLGKVKLSSTPISDQPFLSHYDMSTTSDYSWSQNSSGRTILNAKTGQDIDFRINNVTKVSVNQDGILEAGEIRATAEVTAYYGSDIALKKNIKPISNALDKLLSIGGYNFDWKAKVIKDRGGEDGFFVRKKDVGIIAQEIEKVIPEIVVTREDGTKAVKYEKIVPLLIESIKELTAKVIRLEDGNNK